MTHHNGSLQVFAEGERLPRRLDRRHPAARTRPRPDVGGMMQQGMDAMKKKLEADAAVDRRMIRQSGGAAAAAVSYTLAAMRHYHLFETKLGLCGDRVER